MRIIIYYVCIALVFSACSPFKLSVSDELKAAHDEYPVKGRQGILIKQKLSFGEFQTTKVKRSWTKGSSGLTGVGWGGTAQQDWVNIISVEYINKKQTVNFSMSDGKNSSEVFCVSRFNAKDLQIGKRENSLLNIGLDISGKGGSSESNFYIQVFMNDDETPWQLLLDNQASQAKAKSYVGFVGKDADNYYTIHPVTRLEKNGRSSNTLLGSVGFELRNAEGKAIAAVSLIDKGMVFLGKTTPEERFLMANVCAALLLQEEIG